MVISYIFIMMSVESFNLF